MNLIDKDALIESLGIETDCYDCEHERMKYHCDLDPVEACTKIVEAPVITVTTESAEKAIEVLKNAAWLGAVYSFKETEEAVKTAIRALQVASAQHNVHDFSKDADCISRQAAIKELESGKDKKAKGEIGGFYNQIIENDIEKLRKLPTAQPEPSTDIDNALALLDAIRSSGRMDYYSDYCALRDAISLISAQPEIIRCKDCRWKYGAECVRFAEIRPFPDDFCSRAERKDE